MAERGWKLHSRPQGQKAPKRRTPGGSLDVHGPTIGPYGEDGAESAHEEMTRGSFEDWYEDYKDTEAENGRENWRDVGSIYEVETTAKKKPMATSGAAHTTAATPALQHLSKRATPTVQHMPKRARSPL
jgi:hypothetical protein